MTTSLNLDTYLRRIEWGGVMRQDLETLSGLLRAHMLRIPFENLDVLLGRPVRIDLQGVQDKLVHARRGGYCFEHATLFAAVLEAFGFQPVRHSARVTMMSPRTDSPRTHMFLTVPLAEGRFVIDPGFGTLAPQFPVLLADGAAFSNNAAANASHSMVRDGDMWILRAASGGKTTDAWVSTLEQNYPVDFEMGNHFTSTYPSSPFKHHLMMRALTGDGRVTVMDSKFTIWRADVPDTRHIADRQELRALLAQHFGIDLPEAEHLRVPAVAEWAN